MRTRRNLKYGFSPTSILNRSDKKTFCGMLRHKLIASRQALENHIRHFKARRIRQMSKQASFAYLYGASHERALRMSLPKDKVDTIMGDYHKRYPALKEVMRHARPR